MEFTKRDILEALGFETSTPWVVPMLVGVGIGAVVGAAVAIIVAPKSGAELRSDLLERGRDLMQRGRDSVSQLASRVDESVSKSYNQTSPATTTPKY